LHIVALTVDKVFKALADESRRKLLDELRRGNGQRLADLCGRLDMTRQAVSKHLKILEEANLIATMWHGREKLHYLNPVPLHEVYERWISKFERPRLQALFDLKGKLENQKEK
jgi:DNA-binding transcriptional ArsR family regulator